MADEDYEAEDGSDSYSGDSSDQSDQSSIEIKDPRYVEIIKIEPDGSFNAEEISMGDVSSDDYKRAAALNSKIKSAKSSGTQSMVMYFTGYYTGGGNPTDVSFEIDIQVEANDTLRTVSKKINDAKREIESRETNLMSSSRRGVTPSLDLVGKKVDSGYKASFSGGRLKRPAHRPYIGSGGGGQSYL